MRQYEKNHIEKKWLHLSILYVKLKIYKENKNDYKIVEHNFNNKEEKFYYMFGEK